MASGVPTGEMLVQSMHIGRDLDLTRLPQLSTCTTGLADMDIKEQLPRPFVFDDL